MTAQSNRPVDWEQLVETNENRLYRTALAILGSRQEAEDAVQDTFLRYLEKTPAKLEDPGAWLTRVLVNRCRDIQRRNRVRAALPLWEELPAPGPEERRELEELYALKPEDRAVIHLHYYEGWSTAELARLLGLRETTVRSRLCRARARLRKLLEDAESDDK